mmetsp:Transcript_34458/g.112142  ORF Transcript_34458/g.112142 Transcript_34458/m.112142 type:complete len:352 (+) Transcript_34458:473-1528(+)
MVRLHELVPHREAHRHDDLPRHAVCVSVDLGSCEVHPGHQVRDPQEHRVSDPEMDAVLLAEQGQAPGVRPDELERCLLLGAGLVWSACNVSHLPARLRALREHLGGALRGRGHVRHPGAHHEIRGRRLRQRGRGRERLRAGAVALGPLHPDAELVVLRRVRGPRVRGGSRHVGRLHLHQQHDRLACPLSCWVRKVQHRSLPSVHVVFHHRHLGCDAGARHRLGPAAISGADAVVAGVRRLPAHRDVRRVQKALREGHFPLALLLPPRARLVRGRRGSCSRGLCADGDGCVHAVGSSDSRPLLGGRQDGQPTRGLRRRALARQRESLRALLGQASVLGRHRFALLLAPADAR